ncbi:MAG: MFS transporter [Euryarchaeota archaeon]|nr:MFS transporter [Euryarchaeota archaeon]
MADEPAREVVSIPTMRTAAREQRKILAALDSSRTKSFHLKTIVIAGMGFYSDAYDLFVISMVLPILAFLPGTGATSKFEVSALAAAALFGAVAGQVFFGFLADKFGRKRIYSVTLSVMVVGAIGSALSGPFMGMNLVMVLVLWRFLLGFGVGGDYPLSATIMSEYSNVRNRGRLVASVFAMQGFGLLTGACVALVTIVAFPNNLDLVWRSVLAFGAVPALATIYFRTKMPETPRFQLAVSHDAKSAARTVSALTGTSATAQVSGTRSSTNIRVPLRTFFVNYGPVLFGTAACWFLLDIAFYFSNIFNPTVLTHIGFVTKGLPTHQVVLNLAEGNILIAVFATVPGYWAAVALIDRWGRRGLQILGFGVMAISFTFLAVFYNELLATSLLFFLVVYATTFFFANFGPNTTTFVIPSEVYPTQFRGTGHGISAASGKMGAAIATFFLPLFVLSDGLPATLMVLAGVSFLGFLISLAVTPETAGRALEDVSREDELHLMVERFSGHLEGLVDAVKLGAIELKMLLDNPPTEQAVRITRIRAIEHSADEAVHQVYVDLNNKVMKSQVRSDVGALASHIDDIMDGIESVSARMQTYHFTESNAELRRFADIVVQCVDQVGVGIRALDRLLQGENQELQSAIIEVNRLENEADDLLRVLLERLFNDSKDPVEILKLKDLYERLEVITDRCEDVTDVFQDLMVRYVQIST